MRRAAEIPQNHFAVSFRDFFPGPLHDVVKRLLEIELRYRRNGRAVTALAHNFLHRFDDFGELVHNAVVAQHLRICRQSAAGQRRPGNARFHFCCFGRQQIIA